MATTDYTTVATAAPDEVENALNTAASLSSEISTPALENSSAPSFSQSSPSSSVAEAPLGDKERPSNVLYEGYPASSLDLPDHHIDDVRSLRVVVIGAGIAGITASILLPAKVPNIQLTVLEKNEDVVCLRLWNFLSLTDRIHLVRNVARKCLSRGALRHSGSCLPINICPKYTMVTTVCSWRRD